MRDALPTDETPISTPQLVCASLHADLDAAVAQSAPDTWRNAPESCFRDAGTGETCVNYHRSWQYLLMLGIRNSTYPDTGFLLDRFRSFARCGDRRILISGSADYAMLAHINRAYELEDREPQVTIIDRCETPLALNRWYAERVHVPVHTERADAISFVSPDPFDIVCTHSFVGWFSPEDRDRLVAGWAGNLRSGGHVVTTRRLREATLGNGRHAYDTDELKQFEDKVRDAALAQRHRLGVDPEAVVQSAIEDARTRIRYTTTSSDDLVALFERNNFQVIVTDTGAGTAPGVGHQPSGPVRGAGKRVRIVARRRAQK